MQTHDIEPMQKIGAKLAARHFRFEILMRRREHASIGANELASADAIELARREHAQQTRLQRQRHVADLVEKQRAARGLLETSRMPARGARERADFVAEQFGFEQFGRNRSRVECDERPRRARALAMQRARDELLAGAGFARDQHAEPARGYASDRAKQLAHRGTLANELLLLDRVLGDGRRARPRMDQRARRGRDRLIEIERLGQIIERAMPIRSGGRCDVGERAHDDDRKSRLVQRDAFEQFQAADARHAHVGVEQRGRFVGERRERIFGAAELARHETRFAKRSTEHEPHAAIVIDNPDRCLRIGDRVHARAPSSETGSSSVKTVAPGRLA